MPNLLTAVRETLLRCGLERYQRAQRDGFDCSWHTQPGGRVVIVWRQVGGKRDNKGFMAQDTALADVARVLREQDFNVSHWRPISKGGPGAGVSRPMVVAQLHPSYPFRPRARKKPAAPAELSRGAA